MGNPWFGLQDVEKLFAKLHYSVDEQIIYLQLIE
jgi:hypothetical protein